MSDMETEGTLTDALDVLRGKAGDYPFKLAEINAEIVASGADAIPEDDLRAMMLRRWGSGVEPYAIGGRVWKFGRGQPPVSKIIGRR